MPRQLAWGAGSGWVLGCNKDAVQVRTLNISEKPWKDLRWPRRALRSGAGEGASAGGSMGCIETKNRFLIITGTPV